MHPIIIAAVPLGLIFLGMVMNNWGLAIDQPPSSPEQDPVKRLAAERENFRKFFDRQRNQAFKRQKRIGRYAWLLLIATLGSFIYLYVDTVGKTTLSNRIAALQTLGSQEGKELVLSVTLNDGNNVKYKVKLNQDGQLAQGVGREPITKETVSSWELEKLDTILSIGDSALPLGVALKVSNGATSAAVTN